MPASVLAGHAYLFGERDPVLLARFLFDLRENRGGGQKLIDKLSRLRRQNMGRLTELQVNALIIQAWNAYRSRVPVTLALLDWDEQKPYPKIL